MLELCAGERLARSTRMPPMTKTWLAMGAGVLLAGCGDNITPPAGDDVPEEARVVGHLWSDDNRDGVQDAGEAPLAGFQVFLDLDEDGAPGAAEPVATTDAAGGYAIAVAEPG